jgi:polar amino acid transport system substrate-binding protein
MSSCAPDRWAIATTALRGALACLVLVLTVAAAAQAKVVCPEKPLRVAFDDRGLNYFKGKGFDIDIARELSKRSGCAMAFSEMPRIRIFDDISRGQVDIALFAIQTPERDKYAWFAPYMVHKNYVVMAPNAPRYTSMQEFEDDPSATLAVVRGFTHGKLYNEFIDRLRSKKRVYETPASENLLRMVASNRVQAVLSLPSVMTMYGKTTVPEIAALRTLDWDPDTPAPEHCLMLSKNTIGEVQAREWQALMAGMVKDGTVRRLLGEYLSGADLQRSLLK